MKRIAAVLAVAAFAVTARAGTATDQFDVKVVVPSVCSITVPDFDFGSYDPHSVNSATGIDAVGSNKISVKCTGGSGPQVALNDGANVLTGQRRMKNGSAYLNYELYSDSGYGSPWRTAYVSLSPAPAGLVDAEYDLYGKIDRGQNVPVGTYTDTITATVSF
jgi:spore coat protein U-like protein